MNLFSRYDARRGRERRLPSAFFLTDETRTANPLDIIDRLERGVGVIFRHYGSSDRQRLGQQVAALCRRRGLFLVVAGDPALARQLGADGLHLPEWLTLRPPPGWRRPEWIVTAAAHSLPAALRARRLGADALLVSPVFPTRSHPGRAALGPHRLARLAAAAGLPVYALGGVSNNNMRKLPPGVFGTAGISEYLDKSN